MPTGPQKDKEEAQRAATSRSNVAEADVSFLDKPFLDVNEVGGPLEPLKEFIRDDPEGAPYVLGATTIAFGFFFVVPLLTRIIRFIAGDSSAFVW